jgi:hypothetical protein
MTSASKIEFQVDEQYENEKGVFTVISIHRDEMVIRWEDGEEIRTKIELQQNIQARRQWEEMNRKAKAAKKSSAASKQQGFIGFLPGDFKNTASGTNWRGRTQLGGTVAAMLPDKKHNFNSWAFAQKPELHWLDTKHRRKVGAGQGSRFFVRLSPTDMTYGFCVQRASEEGGQGPDWEAFIQWALDGGDQILADLAAENGLAIYDRNRPASGTLVASDKGWRIDDGAKGKATGLAEFIDKVSENDDALLEVSAKMDKVETVSNGKDIVNDIVKLFSRMVSLYDASLGSF